MRRLCQNSLSRPAAIQAVEKKTLRNTEDFRPFGNTMAFSIQRKNAVAFSVSGLLGGRSPSAVARFVVAIALWVTIQGTSTWAFSHVGKEVCKDTPPGAYGNSASAVVAKIAAPTVSTSLDHRCPCLIRAGVVVSFGVIVSRGTPDCNFSFAAPTRSRNSTTQMIGINRPLVSAFASAEPHCPPTLCRVRKAQDGPSTKRLPGEINSVVFSRHC